MRIRQFASAAALLTVALAAAGCGPDDASGTGSSAATTQAAPPPAASAAPSASAAATGSGAGSAAPAGKSILAADEASFEKSAQDPKGCAEFYNFHQVLSLTITGNGQLKATKVKSTCSPYGLQLDFSGPEVPLKIAPNIPVAMFTKATGSKTYPRYTAQLVSQAEYAKVRKPCFDIEDPAARPAGLVCGQNLFVYTADASGTVNTMHETYETTD